MTAKRKLLENSMKGWLIVISFMFLASMPCDVKGQAMTFLNPEYDYVIDRHLLAHNAQEKTDKPLYLGYEIALGRPIYTLKSDLNKLNDLRVPNLGVIAGGVVANKFGKLRGNMGLYYSDASLPNSFDLFTGGLSANVYLLRIGNARYRTVEPYFNGGISQQHIKFYGTYLDQNNTQNTVTSGERFLGRGVTTQFNVGLGAEYQLENVDGDFIHLFAEVTYGVPVATRSTRKEFDRTHIISPVSVNIGVSFGKIKQRS